MTDSNPIEALRPIVDSGHLVGAVTLIATQSRVLQIDATGYADREAGVMMRPDTFFWIASVTKPMTATALMMLVDEGKIQTEDPVEKYLPDFHGQMCIVGQNEERLSLGRPSHPITVHEVLAHTSGLPFLSRVEKVIDGRPLSEATVSYAMSPLNFQPGTRYQYSNAGINTAGRIIEVASGQSYQSFMQQRLFDPLGMTDTTFCPSAEQLKRLAKTYKPLPDKSDFACIPIEQLSHPLDRIDRFACPAGGLFSTANDVGTFGRMILNGGALDGRRYLPTAAVRKMTSTQTGAIPVNKDSESESGYGFGFSTTRRDPGEGAAPAGACGHGGAYANQLWIDPATDRVLIFMVQHAGWRDEVGSSAWSAFKKRAISR